MALVFISCCAIPCFAEDSPSVVSSPAVSVPDSSVSVVSSDSIVASSAAPDSAASSGSISSSTVSSVVSVVPAAAASSVSASSSPTIWEKPFSGYTPTEGYLFICSVLLCLAFIVLLAKKGVF